MNTTENEKEKKRKKVGDYLKDKLQIIAVLVVSTIYIFQGFFELEKKETTIWAILGNIGLSIIVGLAITTILNNAGLKDGTNDDKYISSMKAYGETKQKATPFFDKLSSWCHYKNEQELEYKKKDIIQSAGLSWKGFKVGYYEEHQDKISEEQIKAIETAKKCKIAKVKSDDLLSDLPKQSIRSEENKFGEDKKDYQRKEFVSDLFIRVGTSIICGLYILRPIMNSETIGNILWNAGQIVIWLSFGIIKYHNAKTFIVDEYRHSHIILKTEYLNEFIITMQSNPDVINKYVNDDNDIDKFIEKYIKEQKEIEEHEQKAILD